VEDDDQSGTYRRGAESAASLMAMALAPVAGCRRSTAVERLSGAHGKQPCAGGGPRRLTLRVPRRSARLEPARSGDVELVGGPRPRRRRAPVNSWSQGRSVVGWSARSVSPALLAFGAICFDQKGREAVSCGYRNKESALRASLRVWARPAGVRRRAPPAVLRAWQHAAGRPGDDARLPPVRARPTGKEPMVTGARRPTNANQLTRRDRL
jgi:hypothetical protein